MSLSLFDISSEFFALKDLIDNDLEVDEETGEITDNSKILKELFDNLKMTLEDKLDNAQRYCLTLDGEADILDKEIKRLNAKKQALNNKKDRLKKIMLSTIENTGQSKFKTSLYSFNIKNSEALEVDSIDNIPREFLRIKKEADKTAIKKALKDLRVGNTYADKKGNVLSVITIIGEMVNYVIENDSSGILEQSKDKFLKENIFLNSEYKIQGCRIVENKSLMIK